MFSSTFPFSHVYIVSSIHIIKTEYNIKGGNNMGIM